MNKNQRKFIEEAIKNFGGRSSTVMLKELKKFSEESGLILPTTYLQRKCKVKRGWFDLTKSGIKIQEEKKEESFSLDKFINTDPIEDVSIHAEKPKKQKQKPKTKKIKQIFRNPVFVVQNNYDESIYGITDNFKKAFDKKIQILHDHGILSEKDAKKKCDADGFVIIKSTNSDISCRITKYELNE